MLPFYSLFEILAVWWNNSVSVWIIFSFYSLFEIHTGNVENVGVVCGVDLSILFLRFRNPKQPTSHSSLQDTLSILFLRFKGRSVSESTVITNTELSILFLRFPPGIVCFLTLPLIGLSFYSLFEILYCNRQVV